jgi:putative (di)nucleoside polyphosphate hydrolase
MRVLGRDGDIQIATKHAEVSRWAWMSKRELIGCIVPFKRSVYGAVFDAFGDRIA